MMFVLDTDILTLLLRGHERVTAQRAQVTEEVALTAVTRIEMLQGRFAAVLKAENGDKLLRAHERLVETEKDIREFMVLVVNGAAAAAFDRLRQDKKLKKIRRGDLLIAAIALANCATSVTRNLKDFRQVPGLQVENWAD
jgi:tRNA(fMet)-specific endonuclease VapC